ncbi:hypothetical protein Tco_1278819 [Tanacetum coccineum]
MKREGKDFSGRVTPLFATMMVQANQEEGVDSGIPTDSQQTPITTQPSSSRPQKKQSRRKQRKETEVPQDETHHDDSIPIPSNDLLLSGEDRMQLTELMILCTNFTKKQLERKKKSRTTALKRLRKVGESRRVKSSEDKDSLGAQEDASKQGRSFKDIDKDAEVSLVDETQGRSDDAKMFDTYDLHGDEVICGYGMVRNRAYLAASISPTIVIDEITLDQTLIEIKVAKPKAVNTAATTTTTTRPKAGGVVVQEPNQVALDEEMARNLKAQLQAEVGESRRVTKKKEEEANIALIKSWENTQAMITADRLLAKRLQTREQEELTDEEKAELFMEFMDKRRKHFTALRA